MRQFTIAVLVVSLVISLVVWLCLASFYVAALVAVLFVSFIVSGATIICAGLASSFIDRRKLLKNLASSQCPQCHRAFGAYAASRAQQGAPEKDGYDLSVEDFEEWPVECSHCGHMGYFDLNAQQVFAESRNNQTEIER